MTAVLKFNELDPLLTPVHMPSWTVFITYEYDDGEEDGVRVGNCAVIARSGTPESAALAGLSRFLEGEADLGTGDPVEDLKPLWARVVAVMEGSHDVALLEGPEFYGEDDINEDGEIEVDWDVAMGRPRSEIEAEIEGQRQAQADAEMEDEA